MAVTLKQIADLAGVSRGTVDRVLNNRGGVKGEVAQRVGEIARQLGYTPNRAGKALSSARRPVKLGVILSSIGNEFYDEVKRGIRECRDAYPEFTVELLFCDLKGYQAGEQAAAIASLLAQGIQALLISPLSDGQVAAGIDAAAAAGIPVITVNQDIEGTGRLMHVGCNYIASGRTAAGLLGLFTGGSAVVGIVTGSLKMLGHNRRIEGFLSVIKERYPGIVYAGMAEGFDDDFKSYEAVKRLLDLHPQITAVYFTAAGSYGGVMALQEARGGRLPLVLACDDIAPIRTLVREGKIAATICQQPYRQGYEAARHALDNVLFGRRPASDILYTENQIKIAENID